MSGLAPIRIRLIDIPDAYRPAVAYTLGEVATRLGIPVLISGANDAELPDIIYGGALTDGPIPVIPFEPLCYSGNAAFHAAVTSGLWMPEGSPPGAPCDILGGVFRLLALLDEQSVDDRHRDRRGVFGVAALPDGRHRVAATPLVELHVEALRETLVRFGNGTAEEPRWPGRQKWAVLLTHDTDAARMAAAPEVLFNAAKGVVRRDPVRRRMATLGIRARRGTMALDPLFGFPAWRDATSRLNARSAFFLFVRRTVSADLNDCRSTVADPKMDWSLLRGMADDGWEFGLHAPIKAREDLDEFLRGKQFLEDRLERPIYGLRHHYWALDWRKPYLTQRMHVNAGFRYDMSLAWRDAAGFRSGTCLPHRPWDPGRQKALDMYAIPTALMDGHVIGEDGDPETAIAEGIAFLETIRRRGGVAALDWHTESAVDDFVYRGHRRVAEALLTWVHGCGDAWVTTPWELVSHWHQRNRRLGFRYDVRTP